jgi:hypothetical protein
VREYRTYEEKLTDVALGVTMGKDAAQRYGDRSVLITTDTDRPQPSTPPPSWRTTDRSTLRVRPADSRPGYVFRRT